MNGPSPATEAPTAETKGAAKAHEEVICGCTGLTRPDLEALLATDPALNFERMQADTGAGLRCTACMLDLEHHFVSIDRGKLARQGPARRRSAVERRPLKRRLYDLIDRLSPLVPVRLDNVLPVVKGPGIAQYIIVANQPMIEGSGECAPDMGVELTVRDDGGQVVHRQAEVVGAGGRGLLARAAWTALAVQWMRRGRVRKAGWAWWSSVRCDVSAHPRGWAGLLVCATRADRETLMRRADRALRAQTTRAERRALIAAQWLDLTPADHAEPAADTPRAGTSASPSVLEAVAAEALAVLRDVSERYPGRADTHYHHAVLLDTLHQRDEALEEATAAVSINPGYRAAQTLCARLAA